MGHPQSVLITDPVGSQIELRGANKIKRFGLSMVGPRSEEIISDPWPFQVVFAVTVVGLTGPDAPLLQFGSPLEDYIPVVLGEVRQNLYLTRPIYMSNDGLGGDLTLEVHGR